MSISATFRDLIFKWIASEEDIVKKKDAAYQAQQGFETAIMEQEKLKTLLVKEAGGRYGFRLLYINGKYHVLNIDISKGRTDISVKEIALERDV